MKKIALLVLLVFASTALSLAEPQQTLNNANRAKTAKKHPPKKGAQEIAGRPMQVPESGVKDGTVLDIPMPVASHEKKSNRKPKKGSKKRTRRT